MNFSESIQELRKKNKKRNFNQTLDLIINLKDFDYRRETVNTFTVLPKIAKKRKICAFFENPSGIVDYVITKEDIDKIDPKDFKKLVRDFDFFIANAKLMPKIASKFGKILGTAGKMPNPKIGAVFTEESEENIKSIVEKLSGLIKIRTKEASIKVAVGKESMLDSELLKNIDLTLKTIIKALPKKELNIKSILLKFTMSPPVKVKKDKTEKNGKRK